MWYLELHIKVFKQRYPQKHCLGESLKIEDRLEAQLAADALLVLLKGNDVHVDLEDIELVWREPLHAQ